MKPHFVSLAWNKEKFYLNLSQVQIVHRREDGSSTVVFSNETLKLNPKMTEDLEKILNEQV
jgi:hypothetical protein